jgi:uncharacterized protein (TIGR02996 family)
MRDADVTPFLRAIHERPADSLPRLVFADFLDEHGDWRGPLLRRPAPPSPLRDREGTEVWHTHLGNLHGVQWVGCRRGLLSALMAAAAVYELPNSHLLKEAFRQGWVEHVDLIDNAGIPWADQLELQELPRLGFQSVDDETLEHLPPLPALRELYLNNCRATRAELEWLNDFPRLEFVHASCTHRFGEAEADDDILRFRSIRQLRSLRLEGVFSNTALEHVGRMRGLQRLYIHAEYITDVGLGALASLEELEVLSLGWGGLTDRALEFLARLPRLRRLDLLYDGHWCSAAAVASFRAARPDVLVCR